MYFVATHQMVDNVFCPTGQGGGRDPKCKLGPSVGRSHPIPVQKKESVRSKRSKTNHNPCTKEKQDASDRLETKIANALGAERSGDNLPMDVLAKNGKVGLEIKMIHDAKADKVEMRKDSRQRKEAWLAEEPSREAYTILVDNRDKFQDGAHKERYSGHKIYYREGVGAFRMNQMKTAKSLSDLKQKLGL